MGALRWCKQTTNLSEHERSDGGLVAGEENPLEKTSAHAKSERAGDFEITMTSLVT